MGNVYAAGPAATPARPLGAPPPPIPGSVSAGPVGTGVTSPPDQDLPPPPDSGPGTFEELHKATKDIFPTIFEGAKLIVNKGLSAHFQVSHSLAMSSYQPSGYKFGCTYVGTTQYGPQQAFPVLVGDLDASGNLSAQIVHQVAKNLQCKFISQIQNRKWQATQLTGEYRGTDFTGLVTVANPDLLNGSGLLVGQYLQNITKRLDMGAEIFYQRGAQVPGNQIGIYTLAGRYKGDDDKWQVSLNFTPTAGGLHACYYQKVNDSLQIGAELEASMRNREVTATVGYQLELPNANVTFRGQLDSNYCVGAVLEKKLQPLPFTFALSGWADHQKARYRFGIGLIVG